MRRGWALLPVAMLLLAVAEIVVFVAVAHALGAGWAVVLLAAASAAGVVLLRREGVRGWRVLRTAGADGPAGAQMSHALIGVLGALLLAVPGFLTAVAGLVLILPPGRGLARRAVRHATERRVSSAMAGDLFGPRRVRVRRGQPTTAQAEPAAGGEAVDGGVVEGEVVEGEIVR
ncbi:FxsA family protein [Krasilnikovia sp. MM14-A1259]|uniref:FxsA family protein n=1 Tax=Krasilnikovia sp. MM14-A1259 TaxID=3373539 RepID=UPI0038069847